ncbi:efflux RND transporter periplasmic adaptor subunit [Candidatus Magnetominusculus xianensis]|uniref:Hemolysin secretion protein D n=1 Tax=Candidatus Magnetominusculus xianensis TaxID=1748249 RepID=A0ABR5SHB6_9BACT|nr:efflux RND transporter periplasmic adaptor subunit [Candidatus Magnetominusculus xianensis]KWT82590.1 hemolysin secretion protein D [Candidatus Magnetominusculus xianensis]MBF0405166.1 efflux RND transporter periplasmic adaptor subunit [Nitrospirota bacterium]
MSDTLLSELKIDKSTSFVKRKKHKALVIIIALVVVAAAGYYVRVARVLAVDSSVVSLMYPSESVTVLNASGYVVAERRAAVSSKITGRLISINVEEGSRIKKGDIIARLENDDVVAAKDQAAANLQVSKHDFHLAEAQLKNAELNYQRIKKLSEANYVSRADYDNALMKYQTAVAQKDAAQSKITAAQAALRSTAVNAEYTIIRAPFDAVVLTKNADVGDIITPLGATANVKAAVVSIADLSSLMVEVDVSESNIEKIKATQPCEITLDAIPDKRLRGDVHMIVPTADRTKGAITVKVNFIEKDQRILPEMSAKVAFLSRAVTDSEKHPRIVVNATVISKHRQSVFVITEDGTLRETAIKTGEIYGDLVEITEGLRVGDKTASGDISKLRDGQKIKIKEK